MAQFRLSPQAERDIESILLWGQEAFGEQVRLRYEALLVRAILDVAEQPNRRGSVERSELAPGAMTYHLRFSQNRVNRVIGWIRKPRHFLLYRVSIDGSIEVSRVLHDSVDLNRHLPDEF